MIECSLWGDLVILEIVCIVYDVNVLLIENIWYVDYSFC